MASAGFVRSSRSASISSACNRERTRVPGRERGFIFVEVTIAMVLVAIFAIVSFQESGRQVQIAAEDRMLGALARGAVVYYAINGQFPPDVRTLGAQVRPEVTDLVRLTGAPNVAHTVSYNPLTGSQSSPLVRTTRPLIATPITVNAGGRRAEYLSGVSESAPTRC